MPKTKNSKHTPHTISHTISKKHLCTLQKMLMHHFTKIMHAYINKEEIARNKMQSKLATTHQFHTQFLSFHDKQQRV